MFVINDEKDTFHFDTNIVFKKARGEKRDLLPRASLLFLLERILRTSLGGRRGLLER